MMCKEVLNPFKFGQLEQDGVVIPLPSEHAALLTQSIVSALPTRGGHPKANCIDTPMRLYLLCLSGGVPNLDLPLPHIPLHLAL